VRPCFVEWIEVHGRGFYYAIADYRHAWRTDLETGDWRPGTGSDPERLFVNLRSPVPRLPSSLARFTATIHMMDLDPPLIHAPEFPPSTWINAYEPVSLAALAGRVILVDFWDFTCMNCLRGLPYLREWHARYEDSGLAVIGVHTPEFAFARDAAVAKSAVGRLGIRYPVILDNEQEARTAFATSCWPTRVLIDAKGYIRGTRQGEGGYSEIEAAIQALLRERNPHVALPELMVPVRPEDAGGAVCYPTTPELQVDAVAAGLPTRDAVELALPDDRPEGRIYLEGSWRMITDGAKLELAGGSIVLPYHAATANAVLAASVEPDPSPDPPMSVEVLQDGLPLPVERFGEDIRLDGGKGRLIVEAPRSYNLVRNPDVAPHELRLVAQQPGLVLYAFSFGTCLAPQPAFDPME
jgi:thiol-disulfide isomerase/thioredoxin